MDKIKELSERLKEQTDYLCKLLEAVNNDDTDEIRRIEIYEGDGMYKLVEGGYSYHQSLTQQLDEAIKRHIPNGWK